MDLHLIENIVAIADEKSITKAAEKRFITQSALNQQLQKLEEELGTRLFRRARANWQPTEAGEAYLQAAYDTADRLFGSFDGFLREGLGITQEERERLRERYLEA